MDYVTDVLCVIYVRGPTVCVGGVNVAYSTPSVLNVVCVNYLYNPTQMSMVR